MEVGLEVNAKHDRQCIYNVTLGRVRAKAISITYSECVSAAALVIQHASCYTVMWPVRLYSVFPHYLINATIFGKSY